MVKSYRIFLLSSIALLLFSGLSFAEYKDTLCGPIKQQYYKDRERGWFFYEYCEPLKPDEKKDKQPEVSLNEEPGIDWDKVQNQDYLDTLDAETFKKLIEKVKAEAVYNPDYSKMLAYIRMQDYMRLKALNFAYLWRDVLLEHPELDTTVKNPTSNFGARVKDKITSQENKELINEIKDYVGMFFFASGDCSYCHEQIKVLDMLTKDYNFAVKTISNNYCHPAFKECIVDPSLFEAFNVSTTPSIVAVIRDANDKPIFQPIATGIITKSEIIKRLVFYYKFRTTGVYPDS